MRHPRLLLVVLPLLLTGLGGASVSSAGEDGFEVIVNPEMSATEVDRDFLRDAYLKKVTEWDDGQAVHPVDLSEKFPARERFTRDVLHKTPSQLRTYWNEQIFSGKGVPPPEAESTAQVIEYVVANRGAVGYLPAGTDPGHAKVVEVR